MRVLRSLGQDGLSILTLARVFARLNRRRTTAALQRRSKASAGPRPVDPYLPQRALAPFQTQASRIIDPVREVAYILMVQRADFPNSDASEVRRAFQQAAVDGLPKDKFLLDGRRQAH